MNKTMFFLLAFVLLLSSISFGSVVKVEVSETLKGDIVTSGIKSSGNLFNFTLEFYNTGTIAYVASIRGDIYQNNTKIFTAWSNDETLMPGSRKNFKLLWYALDKGDYVLKPRIYFANEIYEADDIEITVNSSGKEVSYFGVKNVRTFYNKILLTLSNSNSSIGKIFVIPYDYPAGWIFEQAELAPSAEQSVYLDYRPTVFSEKPLTILVASEEGYYMKTLYLRRESGIESFILNLLFSVFNF